MMKHDPRELIARARKQDRSRYPFDAIDRTTPIAQQLADNRRALWRFDPAHEAKRLGIEPGHDASTRLGTALTAEARKIIHATPRYSLPPSIRDRYPGGFSAAPAEAETFIITTPTELQPGEGCKHTFDPNTVGLAGMRSGDSTGVATAAPPNGDEAKVWFVVDAPGDGILVVNAQVRITGSVMVNEMLQQPGNASPALGARFRLYVTCSAKQVDYNAAFTTVLDLAYYGMAGFGGTGSGWLFDNDVYTTVPFIIGVNRSGGAVPPVTIGAGVVIGMAADGNGNSVVWDFCPGITVPFVTAAFEPASPVG